GGPWGATHLEEARARQIELEAVAGVLGVETVALTEVMKQFRGSTYVGGFPKFTEALFAKSTEKPPAVHTPVFGPAEENALADSRGSDLRKILKARCPKCAATSACRWSWTAGCQESDRPPLARPARPQSRRGAPRRFG